MSKVIINEYRPLELSYRKVHKGTRILRRLPEGVEENSYKLFEVKPLGPTIGAEIIGVDLRNPVTPELKEELNRALLEWKVIFFRNQQITSDQQVAFSKLWGS